MGCAALIVLDTHAWIWYLDNPRMLSKRAREAADDARAESVLCVSSISTWEMFMLVQKGRLRLRIPALEWLLRSERLSFLRFVPVDNDIARLSVTLPGNLHQDPADRMVIATALSLGAPVITKDRRLRDYHGVESIW